jgi:hypothetical protein
MRTLSWARWATCALAISISIPVLADTGRGQKSLASCTSFDQEDKGEDTVQFTIKNTCTVPVDCSVSWRVICAPDSKKRRSVHPGSSKLALAVEAKASMQSTDASAAMCGDDAWTIDQISWGCQPNKD